MFNTWVSAFDVLLFLVDLQLFPTKHSCCSVAIVPPLCLDSHAETGPIVLHSDSWSGKKWLEGIHSCVGCDLPPDNYIMPEIWFSHIYGMGMGVNEMQQHHQEEALFFTVSGFFSTCCVWMEIRAVVLLHRMQKRQMALWKIWLSEFLPQWSGFAACCAVRSSYIHVSTAIAQKDAAFEHHLFLGSLHLCYWILLDHTSLWHDGTISLQREARYLLVGFKRNVEQNVTRRGDIRLAHE